ncbi:MAG: dynamin family protein [Polyangiaceae bacterium]|nr:dynamin family protein [Polyangiaceae bacterium]
MSDLRLEENAPAPLADFAQRKREVVESLDAVVRLAREIGARALASRVEADVARKLESERFHLVVVGEFNHGKSTLVNALLGRPALPVGVTPTTAAIHHVEWAAEPRARVVLASGEVREVPFSELGRWSASGGAEAEAVRHVEVGVPSELLRDRIVLVDTPGVNDLSSIRAEITYEYVPRSDAVLFVLDAGQPVKESERRFLEERLVARARDKVVFVVAKADIWSPAEREEALAWVRARLAELVAEPQIHAVSAERALGGHEGSSGVPELRAALEAFLARERGAILLKNALGEGLGALELLDRGVDARRRAATLADEQLAERIALLERELAGQARSLEERRLDIREEAGVIKGWARRDLERFQSDVIARLPAVVESATAAELQLHLGAFLEQSFRAWAEAETREIAAALERLTEKTLAFLRADASTAAERLRSAMAGPVPAPSLAVDRFAYDVGVFAMFTLGLGVVLTNLLLGSVLLVGAPVLALWNRERKEALVKRRALELAPGILREAAAAVGPRIDELVDDYTKKLEEWLVAAGEELHREVLDVLQQSREARASAGADRAVEAARCDELADAVAALRARLQSLR